MKSDRIKPITPNKKVSKGAKGRKKRRPIKFDFRATSVRPIPMKNRQIPQNPNQNIDSAGRKT